MKRKPEPQPYADVNPLILPRGGLWWQRLIVFMRSWFGALIILGLLNIVVAFYFLGYYGNPKAAAQKAVEVMAVSQMMITKDEGATAGEKLTKMNSDLMTLKVENESLKSLMNKSDKISNDLISLSKLNVSPTNVYWQVLIKTNGATDEVLLDVRVLKSPYQLQDNSANAKLVKVKSGGDLFDGNTPPIDANYLLISIFNKNDKKLMETKIIKMR